MATQRGTHKNIRHLTRAGSPGTLGKLCRPIGVRATPRKTKVRLHLPFGGEMSSDACDTMHGALKTSLVTHALCKEKHVHAACGVWADVAVNLSPVRGTLAGAENIQGNGEGGELAHSHRRTPSSRPRCHLATKHTCQRGYTTRCVRWWVCCK